MQVEFEDEPVVLRKGLYFLSYRTGDRLYFSENEIARVDKNLVGYTLVTHKGATFDIQSLVPSYVENETPHRESVEGNYFFVRS